MSTIDELIDSARLIVLQPGDMLLFETPLPITQAQAEEVKQKLSAHPALKGHDVLSIGAGGRLRAVRPTA